SGLRRVVVRESLRLGRRSALDVVLHPREGALVTCKANAYAMKKISLRELASWLEGQLGPAGVAVRQETQVDREFQRPEQWWRPGKVASVWQVPVSDVARIAGQRKVPAYTCTPREFALY